ncbi:hypothetical protein BaRGS_00003451 [Batillaria attramentaria]|uniref:F-box domain-containing protein n=1 Tax=Batillaria attramentaria TaxID=370345 RepID=A0ABD0M0K5_9CAEN
MVECLLDLPNELLQHVLRFLPGRDIVSVARTCRRFHGITQIEAVWQHKCQQDYGIRLAEQRDSDFTYQRLYTRLLYQFGHCLGLWKLGTSSSLFGMVVHIKFDSGQITAYHCRAPFSGDVRDPLNVKTELFRLVMSSGGGRVHCRKHTSAEIKVVSRDKISYRCKECLDLQPKHLNPFRQEEFMAFWREEMETVELVNRHDVMARILSVAHSTAFWSSYPLERVSVATHNPLSPVRLGLYKGTYGPHGIELINLTVASNGHTLLGNKLTGDPNVPAGQTSLFLYLKCPMVLGMREQESADTLKAIIPEIQSSVSAVQPASCQPFILSDDFELDAPTRDGLPIQLPNTCRARYHAEGRIAGHGYHNPSMCKAHFIVFEEDMFGVIWLDLDSFSLFCRVKQDLL